MLTITLNKSRDTIVGIFDFLLSFKMKFPRLMVSLKVILKLISALNFIVKNKFEGKNYLKFFKRDSSVSASLTEGRKSKIQLCASNSERFQ